MNSRRHSPWIALGLCAIHLGCGGGASDERAARPNVVLISIDSLRADHLGCYGYERETSPAIDRLAREGVLFENAVSSTSWTLPAHAAVFTALPDSVHGVEHTTSRLRAEHRTLAEELRSAGYRTAGFWSGPFLDPSFGLAQGFDEYVDCRTPFEPAPDESAEERQKVANDLSHEDVTGPRLLREVSRWLAERADEPFFLFVHMWDVHFDYIPPPPYDTRFDPDYEGPASGRDVRSRIKDYGARELEHVVALYDGEIAWTDHHVGEILRALDERGLAERTLVVLTADHGEEFFEHGRFGHRRTLFEESIRVPLVVRLPDGSRAGTRVERVVSLMDIAPTILELAGAPALAHVVGEPLPGLTDVAPTVPGAPAPDGLPGARAAREVALSEIFTNEPRDGPLRSLRGSGWKLVVRRRDGQPVGLFDLRTDPAEARDLGSSDPELRARALEELAWFERRLSELREVHGAPQSASAPGADTELTTELEAELRSLGYIGGDED